MPSSIIILLLTLCSKVFLDNQVGSLPENPTIANVFYRSGKLFYSEKTETACFRILSKKNTDVSYL